MTEIIFIRHGQSANNALPEHLRVCDPGLTELGVEQARLTAQALREARLTHLYCSPFLRSLETARPLAETLGMPVDIRSDIFENGGCYSGHEPRKLRGEPGMSRGELATKYPQWSLDQRISEHGWWGKPYESDTEIAQRARSVVNWLEGEIAPRGGAHALVIHADFKRSLLSTIFQHFADVFMPIVGPLHNVGITRLKFRDAGWQLSCLNATTHLPASHVSQ
jgi:2,3-bisphosphoglycerate-dependent phosphoglycerate mutase